ncbi:hypothetical protein ROS217_20697 [Roseovarius sp. 217]|nr:hypothetical protein ROS217_20697 [Roseovarius sp. 217]
MKPICSADGRAVLVMPRTDMKGMI